MRNPERLDSFYNSLKEIHKENFPDWRFSQFMINFFDWYGRDTFYLEEDTILECFNRFVRDCKRIK